VKEQVSKGGNKSKRENVRARVRTRKSERESARACMRAKEKEAAKPICGVGAKLYRDDSTPHPHSHGVCMYVCVGVCVCAEGGREVV